MAAIVPELQQQASSANVSVGELVRRAQMVAVKLDLKELTGWFVSELEGYTDPNQIPDYRIIYGDLRAHNPANQLYIPVRFDAPTTEKLSNFRAQQSISTIEDLVEMGSESIQSPLSPKELEFVHKLMGPEYSAWVVPFRRVSREQLIGILDRVRKIVLDWALELEKHGIVGSDGVFSDDEKKRAANNRSISMTFDLGDP